MSLKTTYHKIISGFTLLVMLWNIVGWLGTGLIVNHLHSHTGGHYCEVSFCSCEVEDGQSYCTCHHAELHHKNKDGASAEAQDSDFLAGADFCFYSTPHPVDSSPADAMLVFAKFNALCISEEFVVFPSYDTTINADQSTCLLPGFSGELLRPPRA